MNPQRLPNLLALFVGSVALIGLSATATGQENQGSTTPGVRSFDEMTIERITPDQLPDYRPGLPQGSTRRSLNDLPRSLSSDDVRRLSAILASTTVEIIAVHTPPRPYRQTKMVYPGHGVWVSADASGTSPTLVTSADWLEGADAIYVLLPDPAARRRPSNRSAHTQSLSDHVDGERFLQSRRDRLVPLSIQRSDPQVNLAALKLSDAEGDAERFPTPEKGLVLHDMNMAMPGAIFGYSPSYQEGVVPVAYQSGENLDPAFSFYFLVRFSAILGAPIVGPDGHLLALSALRYPVDAEMSLAIPPGAIHYFLGSDRDGLSDEQ